MLNKKLTMYDKGEPVEIVAGQYAGLGGEIVEITDQGYVILLGRLYRVVVQEADLAPLLYYTACIALVELRLNAHAELVARLEAALRFFDV